MIYFVRRAEMGSIKIGFTDDLERRLVQLECARVSSHSLRVMAVMPGGMSDEKALHRRFSGLRIYKNQEWFEPGEELIDFIGKEAHEWTPGDNVTMKIDRVIASKAKYVALSRGVPVAEYISELLRPLVAKDHVDCAPETLPD